MVDLKVWWKKVLAVCAAGRGRGGSGSGLAAEGQVRGHQDQHPADHFPACRGGLSGHSLHLSVHMSGPDVHSMGKPCARIDNPWFGVADHVATLAWIDITGAEVNRGRSAVATLTEL